jgi:hypothetical protein
MNNDGINRAFHRKFTIENGREFEISKKYFTRNQSTKPLDMLLFG